MARFSYATLQPAAQPSVQRPAQSLSSSGGVRWWTGFTPRAVPQSVSDVPRQVLPLNLEALALQNRNFRQVLLTTPNIQLTTSFIAGGSFVPQEAFAETDRLITVIRGTIQIDSTDPRTGAQDSQTLNNGDAAIIPAGTWHAITSLNDSTLTNVYSPPQYEADADVTQPPVVPLQGTAASRTGYVNANSPQLTRATRSGIAQRFRI